jgi:hypothetical protein
MMKQQISMLITSVIGAILLCSVVSAQQAETGNILVTLQQRHPRLFLKEGDEAWIKKLTEQDAFYAQLLELVMGEADRSLTAPVIVHQKRGKRLLGQTRGALNRISHLSMAYRLTGKQKYLARAEKEMLAAAALADWNPSHFLDVAEMATGMAIGYDWLYDGLSAETKKIIRTALIEKALEPGFAEPDPWWVDAVHNWNQVCHTGLALAGLAMAEDEPNWAQLAVNRALEFIPHAMMASYEPDGVYTEGPSYWNYGTTYNVLLIDALDSALGEDFSLSQKPGFKESALYRLLVVGPDGDYFRYSDCGSRGGPMPCLYWFSKKFNQPEIAWFTRESEQDIIQRHVEYKRDGGRLFPLVLLWYMPANKPENKLPLDYLGCGPNPIALFRSSWEDAEPLWLAVKGGNNENNHNHMDAGTFVIIAGNIRWSDDLEKDDYHTLEQLPPELWGEDRYDFFRLGIQGHSTLWLNGAEMEISASASPIVKFFSSPDRSHAVIDISRPWRQQAEKVMRGAAMLNKRSFLIQDEITGAKGEVLWQMMTVNEIEIDQSSAVMTRNNKRFHARILTPEKARFEILPVKPTYKEENQNEAYAKLAIRLQPEKNVEMVTLAVHLWLEGEDMVDTPHIIPLVQWQGDKINNSRLKMKD